MDSSDENGLFNIDISDVSSDEATQKAARRTGQTEDAFQAIRWEYKPRVEDGDIFKSVKLPLTAGTPKLHVQEIIHAVEELYFFRKYDEAVKFVDQVLYGSKGLDDETQELLSTYKEKAQQKLRSSS